MKKMTPEEGMSADVVSENVERLKKLFPEAVTENGVNFDVLRQLLGDAKVLDEGEEKYGLNWHGKKEARQIAITPSTGTLLPCPEESVDWDTTQNLFIEGDNLEVLKLLQRSYANKIKMIYIDPPFNTGKEFIYPDKYQDNLDTYLRYTGQVDDEGMKFSSDVESSGRKHTNWLNMMYPRIKLGRNLLVQDGVMAVHIDENEYANIEKIMDDIFGRENNLGTVVWDKRNPKGKVSGVAAQHEYILFYCKNSDIFAESDYFYGKKKNAPAMLQKASQLIKKHGGVNDTSRKAYKNYLKENENELSGGEKSYCFIDDNGDVYSSVSMGAPDKPETRSHRPLNHPKTQKPCSVPPKGWRYTDDKMDDILRNGRILFGKDETTQPRQKYLLKENLRENVASLLYYGGNGDALGLPFDNPKPVGITSSFIEAACSDGDIVLDFFAGSSTTAHACMEVCAAEKRQLRFIMVQLPEKKTKKAQKSAAKYETIAELSKERIRLAAIHVKEKHPACEIDTGYRVFKLSSSNFQVWNPSPTGIEDELLSHENRFINGRSEQDALYELLLKRGIDLAVPTKSKETCGKQIYSISQGALFVCLDESISTEEVEEIGQAIVEWHKELKPDADTHVFFRDSAFGDDVAKSNMVAILEQNGIKHVRSL